MLPSSGIQYKSLTMDKHIWPKHVGINFKYKLIQICMCVIVDAIIVCIEFMY
jgi:hypothetical protein